MDSHNQFSLDQSPSISPSDAREEASHHVGIENTMVCTATPPPNKRRTTKKVDLAFQPEKMISDIVPRELKKTNDF